MRLKEVGLWEGRRVDLPEQWGAGHTREAATVFQTFWKSWANYIADGSSTPCTVSGWKSFVCNICMKPLYSSLVLELVSGSPVILITMHMLGVLMHCLGESDKKTGLHMFSIGTFFFQMSFDLEIVKSTNTEQTMYGQRYCSLEALITGCWSNVIRRLIWYLFHYI